MSKKRWAWTQAWCFHSCWSLMPWNITADPQSDVTATRHDQNREPPLSNFLGLLVHAETRQKTLVDKFYRLGQSIYHDRVMQISADLGNCLCTIWRGRRIVSPSNLKKSLVTTGNVDSIDHNPSSRTAKDSFHRTAIFLTEHPTSDFDGLWWRWQKSSCNKCWPTKKENCIQTTRCLHCYSAVYGTRIEERLLCSRRV